MDMTQRAVRWRKERARDVRRARRRGLLFGLLWGLLFGFFWGLTPYMFALADRQRGFDATGGEMFFPLVPILIYYIYKSLRDFFAPRERCNVVVGVDFSDGVDMTAEATARVRKDETLEIMDVKLTPPAQTAKRI